MMTIWENRIAMDLFGIRLHIRMNGLGKLGYLGKVGMGKTSAPVFSEKDVGAHMVFERDVGIGL